MLKLMLEAAATAFAGSRRATNSYFWALMIEQLEVLGNVLTRFCSRILGLSQRNWLIRQEGRKAVLKKVRRSRNSGIA